jgi:hypothetical protein
VLKARIRVKDPSLTFCFKIIIGIGFKMMLQVILDHLIGKLACGYAKVSPRPEMTSPIPLFQMGKLFKQLCCASPFILRIISLGPSVGVPIQGCQGRCLVAVHVDIHGLAHQSRAQAGQAGACHADKINTSGGKLFAKSLIKNL